MGELHQLPPPPENDDFSLTVNIGGQRYRINVSTDIEELGEPAPVIPITPPETRE